MKPESPLILLHGWGMNPRAFDALIAQLDARLQIRALALPGHGGNASLPENTFASWTAHLAAQLPEAATLLGWSLGGQLAMRIARDHPHKVSRLILLSTTPRFTLAEDWHAGIPAADLATFGAAMQADVCATLLRFLSLQTRGVPEQKRLLDTLRQTFFADPMPLPDALAAGLDMLLQSDLRAAAVALAQPALVIHGSVDKLTPPAAGAWLAAAIPDAQHIEIVGAAHAPILSHPERVAKAIRSWLDV
jgi:pimeloyl-[acyl-carrier protein] methyl ester esterase